MSGNGKATQHITKRTVDSLMSGGLVWDSEVKGFGVRCQRAAKTFVLKMRIGGLQRWITIGRHGSPWTVAMARQEAIRLLGEKAAGRDPAEARDQAKREPSVAELCDLYLAEGCATKKPSTIATDKGRIERHIKPLLGRKRVRAVTKGDVQRFLHDVASGRTATDVKTGKQGRTIVKGGKGTATRTVGLLGGIFAFAVDRGLRPDNPVRGVKRFKDRKSERFLSFAELTRLGETLTVMEREGENLSAIAAIRLLSLTGARKSEILSLKWGHVDFERACVRLPDSKTGAKVIPLGAPALELLASLPHLEGNPYVLPGTKIGAHLVGLPRAWERIKSRAGLKDVRLHDLRHSFASVAAGAGDSLILIGALLGHRDQATTQRYAHLSNDPLRAAADRISGRIAAAMRGDAGGDVEILKGWRT